jgi:transcriptional regulator with PAS, ATPase and Fis domain
MVMNLDYFSSLPVAITICDARGIILEMNDRAAETFAKDGGRDLIGRSLLDCHSEASQAQILQMLREQASNCYTIEKSGVKKLIYQTPWYQDGEFGGLIEFSFVIPDSMPHFIRD